MERVTFSVPVIDCENCSRAIGNALSRAPGTQHVEVDIPGKQVSVEYDPEHTSPQSVAEALNQAGFPPEKPDSEPQSPTAPHVETQREEPTSRPRFPWYLVLALGVVILAVSGYIGYVLYPRFDLPAVEGLTLLALAAGAGIGSFFSPCAFPLLATLLARQTGMEAQRDPGRRPVGKGLAFASALSIGAAAFLLLSGVVIAAGGEALFAGVTFDSSAGRIIRAIVGGLLIVLGLVQIGMLPNYFHHLEHLTRPWTRWQARYRRQASPLAGFTVFGFGYLLAGFG